MLHKQKKKVRKIFKSTGKLITRVVDFFYPPFRKYISERLFRYAATGGANMLLDWSLFFVVFHYVLQKNMLTIGPVTFSSYIASFLIVFPITLTTGFFLQKYVTFQASEIKGRVQLLRYFSVVLANLLINYIGLKLLVDFLHFYPTPSKMLVTFITVVFSYMSQKKYTFRIKKHG